MLKLKYYIRKLALLLIAGVASLCRCMPKRPLRVEG